MAINEPHKKLLSRFTINEVSKSILGPEKNVFL